MIELDLADLDLPALALHIRVDSPALGLQIQAHRVGEEKLIKLGGEAPARDWSLSSDCRSRVPRSAGDLTCALWRRGSKILRREELLLYGTPLQSPKPSPKPAPSTSLCRRRHRCHRHCRRRRLLGRSCSPRRRRRWRRWLPTLTPIQHPYTLALAPYLPLAAPRPHPHLGQSPSLSFTNSHPTLLTEFEMNSDERSNSEISIFHLDHWIPPSRICRSSSTRQAPSHCHSSSRCSIGLAQPSPWP